MARRRTRTQIEDPLARNRYAIWQARQALYGSALRLLFQAVTVNECAGDAGAPEFASVDPEKGTIQLNPHAPARRTDFWTEVLAHLLLHLGLNHAARREDRDPLLWNVACDRAADRLLPLFKLQGHDPFYASAEDREETLYEQLLEERQVRRASNRHHSYHTYAGKERPDIVGLGRPHLWRHDYESLLAEGIRQAVQETISQAADALEAQTSATRWLPAERARQWVLTEFPLLGALAAQIHIIADAGVCDRRDISVAAVNGFLGEMYLNPKWNLSHEEMVFVYVPELLHVALLHHSRLQGRDPWLWNVACDFVINGWLVEMGVGQMPSIGGLYDPRLQGLSAEAVYDLLVANPRRCKGLRSFAGKLGDILLDRPGYRIYRDEVGTLDDIIRRCMAAGLSCHTRGTLPAGLLEEIRSLFTPPVPWDVELARWMEAHIPMVRDPLRSYARASRRQSSTPDIPRPARYVPQEWKDACTFGVVLDTSGSMDRELLGHALGAIASYAEARDVPAVRLVLCDAAPYDRGTVAPTELRGLYAVQGRGGTVLQPAIHYLLRRPDFPAAAPIMILTDGWCEEELTVPREHCFVLPRKGWREGGVPLRTSAPVFRVLKETY